MVSMHHLRWLVRTATSAIAIGMLSCAVVLPPSGGPEDRTPPLVEECSIPNGMLRIGSQLAIKLTFSEYVERSDIARNLSITPTAPYQLDWSGRRVTIAFDSLRPQTTYRMSIATGFRDLHGNRATEPFTLVFSTGDQLDSCQIHGLITSSVSAPLYAVLRPADSAASALEYRIPAAADGRFLADALPCLRFVVAAYADVNGTGSLEAGEPVGVAAASIQAQPPAQSPSVRIWLGYSSSPRELEVISCRAISSRRIRIEFSAPLERISSRMVQLVESASARRVPIAATMASGPQTIEFISGEPLSDTTSYRLIFTPGALIADSTGASLPDTVSFAFKGLAIPDTLPLSIRSIEPNRDTTRNADLKPVLRVMWTDALAELPKVALIKQPHRDTIPIAIEQPDNASLRVQARDSLEPATTYTWLVQLRGVRSWRGASSSDTGFLVRTIVTLDTRTGGSLSGIVNDSCCNCQQRVVIVRTAQHAIVATAMADSSGHFRIPFLPEGKYELDAFCDQNANGRYDSGSLRPLRYGEPVAERPIPISIKARWDVSGITLRLRR